jgi:hypothetical protein
VGGARRPDLTALQLDSAAVGICARSPGGCTWGGGGGVAGGTAAWEAPCGPRLLPLLPSPPSVAMVGQHVGLPRWQLDGEGGEAGGACEGSLEGR